VTVLGEEDKKEWHRMAVWTQRANHDMDELMTTEGAANVQTVRVAISQWADNVGPGQRSHRFQGTLRYSVLATAENREILSVERG
jgi:hypothetical protein